MTRDPTIRVSAPGKLYLFGEYAVLAGAWSMVAAVDRRVRAARFAAAETYRARGMSGDDDALVRAVLDEIEAEGGGEFESGHFETDVREMYDEGTKLGLGSSAASTIALTAAASGDDEAEVEEPAFRERTLEIAERAHETFQGGVGSGGALVAASMGGVLASRRRTPTSEFSELVPAIELEGTRSTEHFEYRRMSVPDDLEIRAYWLGEPASTAGFVRGVLRRMQLAPADVYRRLRRIAEVAESALEAARADDASAFVESVEMGDRAMERLGRECEVPIITDLHRQLRQAADGRAVAVKPSGAGGGDFSLAVGRADADWRAFDSDVPREIRRIDLAFGDEGLRTER